MIAQIIINVPVETRLTNVPCGHDITGQICWVWGAPTSHSSTSYLDCTTSGRAKLQQIPVFQPSLLKTASSARHRRISIIRCDTRIPGVPSKNSGLLYHVAPMQCYTNRHLRHLLRLLSARAVLWTEMEKVEDLLSNHAARDRRLRHDDMEHPLVLQLGGSDPNLLAEAARHARRSSGVPFQLCALISARTHAASVCVCDECAPLSARHAVFACASPADRSARKQASKQARTHPSKQPSNQASKEISKHGHTQASKQKHAAKQPSTHASSKYATKHATKHARKQASKQEAGAHAREQANKQARKQARAHARKQVSRQATKQTSTQASGFDQGMWVGGGG